MSNKYKCYIEECESPLKYTIEWYGLNQHGKNPLVVDERNVCENIEHLVSASFHSRFGGFPDGITDHSTHYKEHPDLLERVIKRMDQDNPQNQLALF